MVENIKSQEKYHVKNKQKSYKFSRWKILIQIKF